MQVQDTSNHYQCSENKNTIISLAEFTPKLNKNLNDIIRKKGYINCSVEMRTITTKGDNYLGVLYEVDITGETADGRKDTYIFFKTMPTECHLDAISVPKAYANELFAYNDLRKVFIDIQTEANIPTDEQYRMVDSYEESNLQTIILENIKKQDYKTLQRMKTVSLEVAKMAVKQLAKFHCLSFAIRKTRPLYYSNVIKNVKAPFNFGEDWKIFLKAMCDMSVRHFNDDLIKDNLTEKFMKVLNKFYVYLQDKSTVCCLCHGDYRPSNIMMKEINGEVVDIIPIDYQVLNYGSPIHDFVYFIFTSTDRKFRKTHLNYLKNLYYETMRQFLDYFEIDLEFVFPKKVFEEIYKQRLDFGLMNVFLFGPFMYVDDKHAPDITKDIWSDTAFTSSDKFKSKLLETVEEFTEWGLL